MPSTTLTAAAASTTLSSSTPSKDTEDLDIYDEIEIEDMTFDRTLQIYHFPCPCGDRFEISLTALRNGETDVAVCPSCSLMIRVIYEIEDLEEGQGEEKS